MVHLHCQLDLGFDLPRKLSEAGSPITNMVALSHGLGFQTESKEEPNSTSVCLSPDYGHCDCLPHASVSSSGIAAGFLSPSQPIPFSLNNQT